MSWFGAVLGLEIPASCAWSDLHALQLAVVNVFTISFVSRLCELSAMLNNMKFSSGC